MLNYCTLFDHNYLSRGLTLYESLKKHSSTAFTLYILAMDDIAYNWLNKNNYDNIIVQSLSDIKEIYPVLNKLQQERTRAEFSWTLSSFSIQFFLKKFKLEAITYLDSDICFYADPKILFDELKDESVIITPHNYTPKYDQSATSGRYCVQFMYFKNDEGGNNVLEWWRTECEKCCSGIPIDGKFGDQKYLDDWLSRFSGIVHEEKHIGCGIAPWNVQQFEISEENGQLFVQNKITKLKDKLVFFHFHGLKEFICNDGNFVWNINNGYDYTKSVLDTIYNPYIQKLQELMFIIPERTFIHYKDNPKPSFIYLVINTLKLNLKSFIKSFLFFRTFKKIKHDINQKERKFYKFIK